MIVVLGGDGLVLRALHQYLHLERPMFGMNRGTVGFLLNAYRPDVLIERIQAAKQVTLHPLRMTAKTVNGKIAESLAWRLLLPKLALKVAFNIFMTKRVSCFRQYNRIDNLITCKLRGDKRPVFRQFLVDEFYFSAVLKRLDPLFVSHCRISTSRKISVLPERLAQRPRVRFSFHVRIWPCAASPFPS